jgi:hypothetical protein
MTMTVNAHLDLVHQQRIEALCVALESGQYKQARGALKNALGNCCLGVACDVRDPARWYTRDGHSIWAYLDDGVSEIEWSAQDEVEVISGGTIAYLTDGVVAWYGFPDTNPTVSTECVCTQDSESVLGQVAPDPRCDDCNGVGEMRMLLTELNDEWHFNFKQIAQAIRRTFLQPTETKSS